MIPLEIVFLVIFWAWAATAVLFLRNTILPRIPLWRTPETVGLPSETVRFQATDGYHLEGWKIPVDHSRPWILLCHGAGSNRADLLEIAAGLHAAGFNLLLFDFRGHGGSRGWTTSFGWQERHDLKGALAWLGRQPEIPSNPYGVYGISMGASVALMVAAQDERLGAVAADGPYTTLDASLGQHLALLYPVLPHLPFLWLLLATYRMRFGVSPRRVSPQAAVAAVSPRSLLLIQGGQDRRTPLEGARTLYAAAGDPKDLMVVEEAGHLEAYAVNPEVYLKRLVQFFEASLLTN